VAATYKVSRAVQIPVIGVGGIARADDAIQYLLAGAQAIQIGTAIFTNPRTPHEVLDGIVGWMRRHAVKCVRDIGLMLQ
jgi:dihydroorotate dehydrogenase (NAD+) catalytic subunit